MSQPTIEPVTEAAEFVSGRLNFQVPTAARPITYRYAPPPGTPDRSPRYALHTVPVYNARAAGGGLSLDREGFRMVNHAGRALNFYAEDEVKAVYYPAAEGLLKRITGAPRALVFDHIVRCAPMAARGENKAKAPAKAAHNDYTVGSGAKRVRDLLPDEADTLLRNRFAVINVWQPTRGPVLESPLAVCDARTIAMADFIAIEQRYADRIGEIYGVAFNPAQRWSYFPRMQTDEALLLKCFDSDQHVARFTAHTAFDDPTSPPDAPPRESIEVRALVFFSEPAAPNP
jgi:hypothetical protein